MTEERPNNPFVIDQHRLDREWELQPGYSRKAGHRQAEAQHKYNQAKAKLEVTYARLLLAIRNDPEGHGLRAKPNEAEVQACVLMQEEHQAAQQDVIEAEYELGIAKADTVAICHDRRKALEAAVELLSLDYICDKEPTATPEARRKLKDKSDREAYGDGSQLNE